MESPSPRPRPGDPFRSFRHGGCSNSDDTPKTIKEVKAEASKALTQARAAVSDSLAG